VGLTQTRIKKVLPLKKAKQGGFKSLSIALYKREKFHITGKKILALL
jgi:hypothetical protein